LTEFFPPVARSFAAPRDLRLMLLVADRLETETVVILGYSGEASLHSWFCFDIGERKFAIWRTTGKLYEVDKHGAVLDDPIEISDL
jgi:hypothetical protein